MAKLRRQVSLETTFDRYDVDECIGQGGAGRVFGGARSDGAPIALKVLSEDRASTDKRRRFKNEIAFLTRNRHPNIVNVIDYGIARSGDIVGPFYVMHRYDCNLRDLMRGRATRSRAFELFSQILDGVEAAHLQGVVHRDLKPENILYDKKTDRLAIADFGIAEFTAEFLITQVETAPGQRLANFQYAAPEQHTPGKQVTPAADVYAVGLILNEMFTGAVPYGTDFQVIGTVSKEHGFLDPIVALMLRQAPEERPATIADIKALIQRYQSEAVSVQRLSQIEGTVIKATDIDEPLALEPPRLVNVDWQGGRLTLFLDRAVTPSWVGAWQQIRFNIALMGKEPASFSFKGDRAFIGAREHEVQRIIDDFKSCLPQATRDLKSQMQQAAQQQEAQRREQLRREREAEEERLRVLSNIRI